MAYTTFRGMHPFAQFMFSLFVMVVCVLVFMLLSVILAVPFFGMAEIMNSVGSTAMDTPAGLNFLKYAQVVQSIGLFIVPPFILAWLFSGRITEYLMIDRGSSSNNFLYTVLSILLLIPLINFAGEINSKLSLPASLSGIEDWMRTMEEAAKVLTEKFLKVNSMPALLFNIFMVGVLPAVGEELLFRGIIQRIFINWTKSQHWGHLDRCHHLQCLPHAVLRLPAPHAPGGHVWLPAGMDRLYVGAYAGPFHQQHHGGDRLLPDG